MSDYIHSLEPLWGNWYVESLIGEGTFGKVYKIKRVEFDQVYYAAAKIVSIPQNESEIKQAYAEGMNDAEVKAYFKSLAGDWVKEVQLMSSFKGVTNIVSIEDFTNIDKKDAIGWDILIRMELLTSFAEYAKKNTLTRRDVIKIGLDICKALEHCQKMNVIHRDIKPENIFVSSFGDYKLGDFGIARTLEKTTAGLSKKGTYSYMAPEVYKGQAYNTTVDTYSLGIVLYRLLNNNRTPFLPNYPDPITYSSREIATAKRMSGDMLPQPLNAKGRLAEIVLKACAYNPKDRYENPKEMRESLKSILYTESEAPLVYPSGDQLLNNSVIYISENGGNGTEGIFEKSSNSHENNRTASIFSNTSQNNVEAFPMGSMIGEGAQINQNSVSITDEIVIIEKTDESAAVVPVNVVAEQTESIIEDSPVIREESASSEISANAEHISRTDENRKKRKLVISVAIAAALIIIISSSLVFAQIFQGNTKITTTSEKITTTSENVTTTSENVTITSESVATTSESVIEESSSETQATTIPEPVILSIAFDAKDKDIAIDIGAVRTLAVVVTPLEAAADKIIWKSSDDNIATVDELGTLTTKTAGVVTITASSEDGSVSVQSTITVSEIQAVVVPVQGVSLNKSSITMTVGQTKTLSATVSPLNATNLSVVWQSNNTAIAKISGGNVTAKNAGTAAISVTTADGSFVASCVVTVEQAAVTITAAPTAAPTVAPTAAPTVAPTAAPTVAPTAAPTVAPTAAPTVAPTVAPTAAPTVAKSTMPNVVGMTTAAATTAIGNAGLIANTSGIFSDTIASGNVISQSIAANTVVNAGSAISIVVSKGPSQPSGWVDALPAGVNSTNYIIETKTQYQYRDKQTTTSTASTLNGWVANGSSWSTSPYENTYFDYASFPAGFANWHTLYNQYNKTPISSSTTSTVKTVASSAATGYYCYFHWCRGLVDGGGPYNRFVCDYYDPDNSYTSFAAFGSGEIPFVPGTAYQYSNPSVCTDSYWWFRISVYRCTYQKYSMIFSYYKWTDWSAWQDAPVSATADRNVNTKVQYRYRTKQ